MRKAHLILLAVTIAAALFSGYSLAAINYIYRLNYEWYSQFNREFMSEPRQVQLDRWRLPEPFEGTAFKIISAEDDISSLGQTGVTLNMDYEKYFFIYVSLGRTKSPEYGIKIAAIAQRGNVIEVKVSMNSPQKEQALTDRSSYLTEDLVRVKKSELSMKGNLHFIFKLQDGREVYKTYCIIK